MESRGVTHQPEAWMESNRFLRGEARVSESGNFPSVDEVRIPGQCWIAPRNEVLLLRGQTTDPTNGLHRRPSPAEVRGGDAKGDKNSDHQKVTSSDLLSVHFGTLGELSRLAGTLETSFSVEIGVKSVSTSNDSRL